MAQASDSWESFLVGEDEGSALTGMETSNSVKSNRSNSEYDLLNHAADISLFSMEQGDIDDTLEHSTVIYIDDGIASPCNSKYGIGQHNVETLEERSNTLNLSPIHTTGSDFIGDQQLNITKEDYMEPDIMQPRSEAPQLIGHREDTWQSRLAEYRRIAEPESDGNILATELQHQAPRSRSSSDGIKKEYKLVDVVRPSSPTHQPRRFPNGIPSTSPATSSRSCSEKMKPSTASAGHRAPLKHWSLQKVESKEQEWKQHSVNVAVRVRPFSKGEIVAKNKRIVSARDNHVVVVNPNMFNANPDHVAAAAVVANIPDWAKLFHFNHCLWSYDPLDAEDEDYVDQEGVFRTIGISLVLRALKGESCSCFSYGQAVAGKTHSLFGSAETSMNNSHGLIPRVFNGVISAVLDENNVVDTKVTMSFLEIYNEKIRDLLVTQKPQANSMFGEGDGTIVSSDALRVREHSVLGPYVVGATNAAIHSVEDMFQYLALGLSQRLKGPQAGRAHVVVTLELTPLWQKNNEVYLSGNADKSNSAKKKKLESSPLSISDDSTHQCVKIQMVDLAGSQRELSGNAGNKSSSFSDSNSQAKYTTEKTEMKLIGRSLSTLGYIIRALGKGVGTSAAMFSTPTKKLPYRDSILTWLMKDSLCTRNYVTVLAVVSPAASCYEETINTLKFAERLCTLPPAESNSLMINDSIDNSDANISAVGASNPSTPLLPRLDAGAISNPNLVSPVVDPFVKPSSPMSPGKQGRPDEPCSDSKVYYSQMKVALGAQERGTAASRAFLMETVSDPQQRLAKMNDGVSLPSAVTHLDEDQFEAGPGTPQSSQTYLRDAYRDLQGQMVALQMELDAARTDRDTLRVKLLHKGYSDDDGSLFPAPVPAAPVPGPVADADRKVTESEDYLSKLVIRKEEIIEQLLSDLNDEARKREQSEHLQETQRRDFMDRLEENKRLMEEAMVLLEAKHQEEFADYMKGRAKVDSEYDSVKFERDKFRDDMAKANELIVQMKLAFSQKENEMGELRQGYKHSLNVVTQEKESALQLCQSREKETNLLTEEISSMKRKIRIFSEQSNTAEGFKNLMHMEREDEYFRAKELANVTNERNVLSLQVQENSAIIAKLTRDLESMTASASGKSTELSKLQHIMKQLFDSESNAIQSDILDMTLLVDKVGAVKDRLLESNGKIEELEWEKAARHKLEIELSFLKEQLSAKAMPTNRKGNNFSEHEELQYFKNIAKDLEKSLNHWKQLAQAADADCSSYRSASPTQALSPAQPTNFVLQLQEIRKDNDKQAREIEILSHEKQLLSRQLANAADEANSSKQNLKESNETMKLEFSALWNTVQQLTALDATKDAAYEELVKKRDAIIADKNNVVNELEQSRMDNAILKRELAELDKELMTVLDKTEHLSPLKSVQGLRNQRLYDQSLSLNLSNSMDNNFNPNPIPSSYSPTVENSVAREERYHHNYGNDNKYGNDQNYGTDNDHGFDNNFRLREEQQNAQVYKPSPPQIKPPPSSAIEGGNSYRQSVVPNDKVVFDANLNSASYQTPSSAKPNSSVMSNLSRPNSARPSSADGHTRPPPGSNQPRSMKQNMIEKFRKSDTERLLSEQGLEAQLLELSSFLERDKARLNSQQLRTQSRSDARSRTSTPIPLSDM